MISWITPAGLLFTATEMVFISTSIIASGGVVSYKKISGELPNGLTLSNNGVISGNPSYVLDTKKSVFTVRASSTTEFADRQFSIDVIGGDSPIWDTYTITTSTTNTLTTSTGSGYLAIGINGEPWAIYKQWVDYQLHARTVEAPSTATVKFYIADNDGVLPNGLTLDPNGRLYGFISVPPPVGSPPSVYCFDVIYDDVNEYTSSTNASVLVTEGFRINSVYITASDGVRTNKRLFKILSLNPDIFKASSPFLPTNLDVLDLSILSSSLTYVQTPQFIKSSNLGNIKIGNKVYLPVTAYDPAPITGPVTYSTNITFPGYLTLNTSTGIITGFIDYQQEHKKSYNFNVSATKYGINTGEVITATNTFTFTSINTIDGNVEWQNTGSLGTLLINEISELYVKAIAENTSISLKYKVTDGNLPPGLTMKRDGTICGKVPINPLISTTVTNYNFTVSVLDNNDTKFIDGDFSITVNQTTSTDFTSIWCKPYLHLSERNNYQKLISNFDIFDPASIYRPLDSNFGIQKDLKMFIEFGVERKPLSNYAAMLTQNFQKRKFNLGNIKYAIGKINDTIVHELIYIDVIDNLVNFNNVSIPKSFNFNGVTYYPTSVDNMRKQIANTNLVTDTLNPRFTKTVQPTTTKSLGFIRYVPICFVIPGESQLIIRKITDTGFKFNKIDFEIDRIIIQEPSNYSVPQYLLFPR